MILRPAFPFVFDFLRKMPIVIETSDAMISSDAGLLAIRQFDERIGFTRDIAEALDDERDPRLIAHSMLALLRQRIYGILADYEDQNDHDLLRRDPVFKMIAGLLPADPKHLASQPSMSRFENAIGTDVLFRLRDVMFDQFLASFEIRPPRVTIDLDAFDDPTHGDQQLTFFHGFYEQYQYLPIVASCAENDMIMLVGLRFGTCPAFLGADDDLRFMVRRIREVWPDMEIHVRADCGFGVPLMYRTCEELGVTYTIGIGMNATLKAASDELLNTAIAGFESTGQKQRLFMSLNYQAESWDRPRTVIIKAEMHSGGENRRAVVSDRPAAWNFPESIYDEYTQRGESENRNFELKCDLRAERLSDHRFKANFFRLYLHTFALNLLMRLRNEVRSCPTPESLGLTTDLPVAALPEDAKRTYFNRRRMADVLGEGRPSTWRTRLIKVAAEVTQTCRRIVVKLSGTWPFQDHFEAISGAALAMPPPG